MYCFMKIRKYLGTRTVYVCMYVILLPVYVLYSFFFCALQYLAYLLYYHHDYSILYGRGFQTSIQGCEASTRQRLLIRRMWVSGATSS